MKKLAALTLLFTLSLSGITNAQDGFSARYEGANISFDYPTGWYVNDSDPSTIVLSNVDSAIDSGMPVFSSGVISLTIHIPHSRPLGADRIFDRRYLPQGAPLYTWTAFRSEDGQQYGLWLVPTENTSGEPILATPGQIISSGEIDFGPYELDEDRIPTGIPGWERIPRAQTFALLDSVFSQTSFGDDSQTITLNPMNPTQEAGVFQPRYTYRPDTTVYDNQTGVLYASQNGQYVAVDGPFKNDSGQITDDEGTILPRLAVDVASYESEPAYWLGYYTGIVRAISTFYELQTFDGAASREGRTYFIHAQIGTAESVNLMLYSLEDAVFVQANALDDDMERWIGVVRQIVSSIDISPRN